MTRAYIFNSYLQTQKYFIFFILVTDITIKSVIDDALW